ncbi:hypothetical protein [Lewinella sp. IMCC34183]|uniref:hypothetical protein n=1 Tax=Lewinella sp. IMCC34183 TaxID=2248762 RepID=UPI0013008762|nr:hypothetical protein [Lewinella sp. IMCC34183]
MLSNLEQKLLHPSLYNLYDDDEFEDYGKIEILNFLLGEKKKSCKILVRFTLNSDLQQKDFGLKFTEIQDYSLIPGVTSYIEILEEDPRLLIHNSGLKSLYFTSPARNPDELIRNVMQITSKSFDNKISIESIFTDYESFIFRSSMDYGLYVTTSVPVVEQIFPLLVDQGMKPSIYESANSNKSSYKILYIANSWIIFESMSMTVVS